MHYLTKCCPGRRVVVLGMPYLIIRQVMSTFWIFHRCQYNLPRKLNITSKFANLLNPKISTENSCNI